MRAPGSTGAGMASAYGWRANMAKTSRILPMDASTGSVAADLKTKVNAGAPSKTDIVLKKLRGSKGTRVQQLADATGWQLHSVRGFLSATVRKKLGLNLMSDVGKDGVRRYSVAPAFPGVINAQRPLHDWRKFVSQYLRTVHEDGQQASPRPFAVSQEYRFAVVVAPKKPPLNLVSSHNPPPPGYPTDVVRGSECLVQIFARLIR